MAVATVEADRAAGVRAGSASTWEALSPQALADDAVLAAIERELDRPEVMDEIRACEASERYPKAVLNRLYGLGLLTLFADPPDEVEPRTVSAWRVNALCALAARRSGSIAVAIAHNGLAMLPLCIAGTDEQLRYASARMRDGALAALLLTERGRGSDLMGIETVAVRDVAAARDRAAHADNADSAASAVSDDTAPYRITGRKHLINGGGIADLLVTLARTGSRGTGSRATERQSVFDAPADLSLFLVERDDTVGSPGKERTLPVAAAAIAGVSFDGTAVPASARIGAEGEGFSIVQRALAISRCAIGAFAAGTSNAAVETAVDYARRRILYGAPITDIDCVADHLARLAALDLAATALSIKATALVGAYGQGVAHYTAAAKLACCALAEQAVDEGRRALGAGALVASSRYERLVRDAPLFGVFDGTSHVMLEHLQRGLARAAASTRPAAHGLEELRDAYTRVPPPLVSRLRQRATTATWPVTTHAAQLAALPGLPLDELPALAEALLALTRATRVSGAWGADQSIRFGLADCYARLEALLALLELADPERRAALGLPPMAAAPILDTARVQPFAALWIAADIAGALRRIALRTGTSAGPDLDGLERALIVRSEPARRELMRHISRSGEES